MDTAQNNNQKIYKTRVKILALEKQELEKQELVFSRQ